MHVLLQVYGRTRGMIYTCNHFIAVLTGLQVTLFASEPKKMVLNFYLLCAWSICNRIIVTFNFALLVTFSCIISVFALLLRYQDIVFHFVNLPWVALAAIFCMYYGLLWWRIKTCALYLCCRTSLGKDSLFGCHYHIPYLVVLALTLLFFGPVAYLRRLCIRGISNQIMHKGSRMCYNWV